MCWRQTSACDCSDINIGKVHDLSLWLGHEIHVSFTLSFYKRAAHNYSAYGLESSRTPSYISCTFDGLKASSGPVSAIEEASVKSTTVTKTETVVVKTEEKKEEEPQQQLAEEPAAVEKKEQEKEEVQEQETEQEQEKEKEQEQVEAEAIAEWCVHDEWI